MKHGKVPGMPGWIELCADVSWDDYGGTWARKARDGSWYVVVFTNLLDAGGEEFADTPYEAEVKRVDFGEIDRETLDRALRSSGWKVDGNAIVNDYDGEIVGEGDTVPEVMLDAAVSYGLGAPLESFTGKVRASHIRAEARRYAEECMRNDSLLVERLSRPVNRIGSTAAEYGRGDIDSAMHRGPFDTAKNLMRKIQGLPPGA